MTTATLEIAEAESALLAIVDDQTRKASRLREQVLAALAATPDPGDEPRPNARAALEGKRQALVAAASKLHGTAQLVTNVAGRCAPWLAAQQQMVAIAARCTCERTAGLISGELDVRQLVDGGLRQLVALQAEALRLPMPERVHPLPVLVQKADEARRDLAMATAQLADAIAAASALLGE